MSEIQSKLRDLEKDISLLRQENADLKKSLASRNDGTSRYKDDHAEIIIRTLLDQAQHLSGIIDLDGVVKYVNQTVCDFIQKEPSVFIGKKIWDTPWWSHSQDMVETLREGIRRAAGGEFVQFETLQSAADGSLHHLYFTLKPARDENGRIFCLIPEAWDITERRKAEKALLESEEKYRSFIEDTGTGYVIIDNQGKVFDANPAYIRMSGHDRLDEILNRNVLEWTFESDAEKNAEAIRKCMEQGYISGFEVDYIHKNGDIVTIEVDSSVVKTESGMYIRALCRDVTERKRAERELDRTRALMDAVIEQSPVPMAVVSAPDYIVRYTNTAASDLLGTSGEGSYKGSSLHAVFAHQTWRDFRPDGTPVDAGDLPLARALRGEVTRGEELIVVRKDGTKRWELVSGAPVYDRTGELMAGVIAFADITERKRAEEALEKRIIALTQPLDDTGNISFEDLFNLRDIQYLQDLCAQVWGVAALITRPDGAPITKPSNFSYFCSEFIRKNPKGMANCERSDAVIGRHNPTGPNIQTCLSAGLCNAGASITVGGRHIANWLIGQVRNDQISEERIMEYAREIGADETAFHEAFLSVPVMSQKQFNLVAKTLFVLANQLSAIAYQNIQQSRFISERNKAEEALRDKTEELDRYFTSSLDLLCIADTDGYFRRLNPEWERTLGYSLEDIENSRFLDFVHPDDINSTLTAMAALKSQTSIMRFENRYRCKNGSYRWIEWRSQPVGKLIYAAARDITERKLTEEALRESEEKLKAVLQGAPIPQFFIDKNHTVIYWNKAIEEYSGIPAGEIIGTQDHWKAFYTSARPCLSDLILDGNVECIQKWYEGKYRKSKFIENAYEAIDFFPTLGEGGMWLYFTASLILDSNNTIVGALETLEDITDRKMVEEALRESKERLVSIFRVAPVGIGLLRNRIMLEVNPRVCKMTGYTEEELIGRSTRIFYLSTEEFKHVGDTYSHLAVHGMESVESRWRRKDGSIIEVLIVASHMEKTDSTRMAIFAVLDITDRKRAEEALRTSESNLSSAQTVAHIGSWYADNKSNVLTWSEETYRIFGIPVGKPITLDIFMSSVHPDDREAVEIARRNRLNGAPYDIEHRIVVDSGIKWVRERAEFTLDSSGEIVGSIGTVQDITERKRTEEELKRRHDFERIITGISTRFINLDPEEIDHAINESLGTIGDFTGADRCILFFFRKDSITADNTHEWCADGIESHKHLLQGINESIYTYMTNILFRSEVVSIPRMADFLPENDSEKISFMNMGIQSLMMVPIEFKKTVVGFLGLDAVRKEKTWSPDIAAFLRIVGEVFAGALERRRAETALISSEERFKRLLQNSSDIITIVDSTGVQTSINGPTERIIGYTPEELIGTNGFDLIHPDDREPAGIIFQNTLSHQAETGRAEYRYHHKNGSWVTVEVVGNNLLHDPVVKGLVLNIRDVSERNRLQEQLQQAMKMEAVGRLAGGVAHDFNNLLTSIICNVELAGEGLNPSDPLFQYLNEVNQAAQSAASLTRQLLAFSRKQIIEPKVLNLNDLVGNIRKMLARLIGEDIEFKTHLTDGLGSVKIDAGQFEQVLVNLSVNARDAMPDGGVLVIETANIELNESYTAHHTQIQPGKYVMLAVSDTGHGMSDEVKKHLFEPFFTTKAMGRGTGLGLATTFGAVQQADGSIEVYSEINKGTTFKIYLPRVDEDAATLAKNEPPIELLHGTETIFVVEDETGVREMVLKVLNLFGYKTLHAPNGGEALMLAEKFTDRIDLLMTDVVMPGMNGRELAERLVVLHPEMKVLFTSGYTENVIVHHGVVDENLNFIGKPYSPQGLARKIREVLGPAEKTQ